MISALYFINEMDKILINFEASNYFIIEMDRIPITNFEASNLNSINEPVGLANLHILLIKARAFR